jgi:hypothetical protein
MDFTICVHIQGIDQPIHVREFKNSHFATILKYIEAGNNADIAQCIECVLQELIVEDVYNALSCYSKFILLLHMYNNYVYDQISVSCIGDDIRSITVLIEDVISLAAAAEFNDITATIADGDILVQLGAPVNLYTDIDNVILNLITNVHIGDDTINIASLSDAEKSILYNNLSVSITRDSQSLLSRASNYKYNIIPRSNDINVESYFISIMDNSMFFFIKSLFNIDVYDFFNNQYVFMKQLNSTHEHFMSITPFEFTRMMKIHENMVKSQDAGLQNNDFNLNNV